MTDLSKLTATELKKLEGDIHTEKMRRQPKTTAIYVHRSKESNFDTGGELGLTNKQMENFMYTGYELEVTIEVDCDGYASATHLAGVPLEKKVKI